MMRADSRRRTAVVVIAVTALLAVGLLLCGCGRRHQKPVGAVWTSATQPAAMGDLAARQANADADPNNWLLYGRNYSAWRYSPLTQINKTNVKNLKVAWSFDTGLHDAFEATPIVVDGTMYVTTPWNHVLAFEAATGKELWRFAYPLPNSIPLCCGAVNRGVAVGRGKVFFCSLDAHLVALDARTGKLAWDTEMADYTQGYSATMAPQIVGNRLYAGISGGDFGVRGFVDCYNADNGARVWRFYTIPGPGEKFHETWTGDSWKTGGGPNWMTPTYDPASKTMFYGIGNPSPDLDAGKRPGDNLFTECTLALDATTGKYKWHYQTIPHDPWDLDNVIEPVLDTVTVDGQSRKVAMWAGKNGFFYMLDRDTGKFIYALQYAHKVNWGTVDSKGKPHLDQSLYPTTDRWTVVYPGASGGKEWVPVAYDPQRKRLFIPAIELGHMHQVVKTPFRPGQTYWGGISVPLPDTGYGHVTALDVEKKRIAWDYRTEFPVVCGVMCTAGGLVVTGTPDQKMLILDSDTGQLLHQYRALSGWHSGPMSFAVNGKQYIGFPNGWGGWVTGFNTVGTPRLTGVPKQNTLYVFALP